MDKPTLGIACKIITGKLDANRAVNGGMYPFFTCAAIPEKIDKYAFDDDVVLIAGNNAQGNFHVNRFKGKFNAYQRTYILTANPDYDIDFIYYSLKLELKRLKERSQGSQTKFLTMPILSSIHIRKLDISDQRKISSILIALDKKIEINNRINIELEKIAQTLYDYWFVQFDFSNGNRKTYKSNGGKMKWNENLKKEIPEDWTNGTLNNLGEIIGGSTPSKEFNDYFSSNGTPWITPKDLSLNGNNKYISKGEIGVSKNGVKAASLKILPKGTVLMSSRAPVGYMAIARNPVTTNQGFKSFVAKSGYSSAYIFYTLKNAMPEIINNASGSTFKEVSGSTLKTIKICLPHIDIIERFTSIVEPIFERQNLLELENEQLVKLRDWLLPMLMNGQIKVKEADEILRMAAEPTKAYTIPAKAL